MPEGTTPYLHPHFDNPYNIPPGDVPDYLHNRRLVLAVTTVLLVISTATTLARFLVRRMTRQSIMADDICMTCALVVAYMAMIGQYLAISHGLGKHEQWVSPAEREDFQKAFFIGKIAYQPGEVLLKAAIILFYMRLFPGKKFRIFCWTIIVLVIIWGIVALFTNVFVCVPASYFWDKTIKGGHCSDIGPIAVGNGAFSTAFDIIIILMPMPHIWKLQIDMRRKIALMAIFAIGIFVCVISVVRFLALFRLNKRDFTYSQLLPGIWTTTEVTVGIICGNLPLLRPLFMGFFKKQSQLLSSSKNKQYSFHNTTSSVGGKAGFARMSDRAHDEESNYDNISDVELKGLAQNGAEQGMQKHLDPEIGRIRVQTEVLVRREEEGRSAPRPW